MIDVGNTTVSVLSTQITLSALSVALIQKLKASSWFPLFHDASDWANRGVSAVTALLTAIGIHLTWTHGQLPGTYMISVSGATLVGVAAGAFAVIKSVVFNELIYRSTVKTQTPGEPGQVLGVPAKQ